MAAAANDVNGCNSPVQPRPVLIGDVAAALAEETEARALDRSHLVNRVMLILSVQMMVTGAGCYLGATTYRDDLVSRPAIYWGSAVLMCALLVGCACRPAILRDSKRGPCSPTRAFFAFFTAVSSVMMAGFSALTGGTVMVQAFACTSGTVLAVTVYAAKTKRDLTTQATSQFLGVFALALFAVSVFAALLLKSNILHIALGVIAVCLYAAYLAHDVQRLLGGGETQYEEGDEFLAALMIYVDILIIMMEYAEMIQRCNNRADGDGDGGGGGAESSCIHGLETGCGSVTACLRDCMDGAEGDGEEEGAVGGGCCGGWEVDDDE